MKKIIIAAAAVMLLGTASAYAADEADVNNIAMGKSREEIHTIIGEPQNISANGLKEVYNLENGRTAVLDYDYGYLKFGFIVEQ